MKNTLHKGSYPSIRFELTEKEIWVMLDPLPGASLRWGYWCRFFTDEEANLLDSQNKSEQNIKRDIKILEKGIDRAHDDSPCFSGDLRDRYKDF